MQVLTLHPHSLEQHAARLAKLVESGAPAKFDAIVAVRHGGSYVCDAFCQYFPKKNYEERFEVTLQRPSTKRKNGIVSRILRFLPYPILDLMRMGESKVLSWKRSTINDQRSKVAIPEIEVPEGLARLLREEKTPNILIIDDAIDSGYTLFAITEALKKANSNATLRIAVMTETTEQPHIRADYSLYRNKTLIRFPWSNDYKPLLQESLL